LERKITNQSLQNFIMGTHVEKSSWLECKILFYLISFNYDQWARNEVYKL
jgi:hypothetical protein